MGWVRVSQVRGLGDTGGVRGGHSRDTPGCRGEGHIGFSNIGLRGGSLLCVASSVMGGGIPIALGTPFERAAIVGGGRANKCLLPSNGGSVVGPGEVTTPRRWPSGVARGRSVGITIRPEGTPVGRLTTPGPGLGAPTRVPVGGGPGVVGRLGGAAPSPVARLATDVTVAREGRVVGHGGGVGGSNWVKEVGLE